MLDLILDVKIYIASFNQEAWVRMFLYDDEFYAYACTKEGCNKFVDNFYDYENNKLFDKLHSIGDKCIKINNYRAWYYGGCVHRDNDLPAIMYDNGFKQW